MHGEFKAEIELDLPDSTITYYPAFFNAAQAKNYFEVLRKTIPWRQDEITVFGKTHPQPRLTALTGNNGKPYSYSNITMQPLPFSKELREIKTEIETVGQTTFTTCLLNRYRNGKDSNGWHSDDERSLGKNPVIASVSFGEPRYFHLRHKNDKNLKHKVLLENGSLLVMRGETQHHWQHQIPKTTKEIGERINLTFRVVK